MCFCNFLFCFDDAPHEDDPRRGNTNRWQYSMKDAPSQAPGYCLYGYFCGPCAQYEIRKRILGNDFSSEYRCCQGYFGFPACESLAPPECCLALEACLCMNFALSANRFYLMDHRNLLPDPVDNQIIRFNNCVQLLACVVDCLASCNDDLRDLSQCLNCLANQIFYCTAGCMTAQMFLELKEYEPLLREENTYRLEAENIPIARAVEEQDSYGSRHAVIDGPKVQQDMQRT